MKVFVIHYKKLIERKKFMLEQFVKHNITNYTFIEIDRDEIEESQFQIFNPNFKNKKAQVAITLSHLYSYHEILNNYDYALILEDDAILCENFLEKFSHYLEQLPDNFDMMFIGNGGYLHIPPCYLKDGNFVYYKNNEIENWSIMGAAKPTDSYIVSKKCAEKICNFVKDLENHVSKPIDWWLTDLCQELNLNVYWAEPTLVTQGTQTGMFLSSHQY
jgi:GR25 family glycosyltransferase involved in LPS biosynthesis